MCIRLHLQNQGTSVEVIFAKYTIMSALPEFYFAPGLRVGRDSVVGVATRRSGDRIPVEARFSAPVQTGPEAHPASYTMGTGSFPRVKRPGRGFDHPPPFSAEVKKE
jgi:hypothetical protein